MLTLEDYWTQHRNEEEIIALTVAFFKSLLGLFQQNLYPKEITNGDTIFIDTEGTIIFDTEYLPILDTDSVFNTLVDAVYMIWECATQGNAGYYKDEEEEDLIMQHHPEYVDRFIQDPFREKYPKIHSLFLDILLKKLDSPSDILSNLI